MDANSAEAVAAQVVTLIVLWGLILALVALSHRPSGLTNKFCIVIYLAGAAVCLVMNMRLVG